MKWIYREFDLTVIVLLGIAVLSAAAMTAGLLFWRRRPPPSQKVFWAAAIVLMAAGTILTAAAWLDLDRELKWLSRPPITGVVISSEVVGDRAFHPQVTYGYTVDGSDYTGTSHLRTPGFGGKRKRWDVADKTAGQYRPGDEIIVTYNPRNPAESRLIIGLTYGIYLQLAFGLLLYGAGIFLAGRLFRVR